MKSGQEKRKDTHNTKFVSSKGKLVGKLLNKITGRKSKEKEHHANMVFFSQKYPDLICIRTLHSPSTFGELAIEKDKVSKRTASIISKNETVMFLFPLNIFRRIKRYMEDPEIRTKAMFFQQISVFSHWNMSNIIELLYHVEVKNYRAGHIVYEVGDFDNYIYFVKGGQFEF